MSALSDVTRWAFLLDRYAAEFKEDPRVITPFALAMVHKESRGRPHAKNPHSPAMGLGQQIPDKTGKILSFPITWDPHDQLRALVGLLHHHLSSPKRAGGHLPSAWLAYASGPGNVGKLVAGTAEADNPVQKHAAKYLPDLVQQHDVYSAWYAGWVEAGRPTWTDTVASGEGKSYRVELAEHVAPARSPLQSPFDGTIRWNGVSIPSPPGTVGSDGTDPSSLARAAASSTSNVALIASGVLGGVAFGALLLAALAPGGP